MVASIAYYAKVISEKLDTISGGACPEAVYEVVEECRNLVDVGDYIIRMYGAPREDVEKYYACKRRLRAVESTCPAEASYGKYAELRPLLSEGERSKGAQQSQEHATLAEYRKQVAYQKIKSKIDEIADVNAYINSMVGSQGETIDNLFLQMDSDKDVAAQCNDELMQIYRRKKRKERFFNVFLGVLFFVVLSLLTFRVVLR